MNKAAKLLVVLAITGAAASSLTACDPSADFVFGVYDHSGYDAIIDASSGPSGEHPTGTLKLEGTVFGTVGCLKITGSDALIGLDLTATIGMTGLMRVHDNGGPGTDVVDVSPSFLPASQLCDATYLEPGPPMTGGNIVVRDLLGT